MCLITCLFFAHCQIICHFLYPSCTYCLSLYDVFACYRLFVSGILRIHSWMFPDACGVLVHAFSFKWPLTNLRCACFCDYVCSTCSPVSFSIIQWKIPRLPLCCLGKQRGCNQSSGCFNHNPLCLCLALLPHQRNADYWELCWEKGRELVQQRKRWGGHASAEWIRHTHVVDGLDSKRNKRKLSSHTFSVYLLLFSKFQYFIRFLEANFYCLLTFPNNNPLFKAIYQCVANTCTHG